MKLVSVGVWRVQFRYFLIGLGLVSSGAGCKLKPPHDMEEQPSVHPAYKPSVVFADGSTARPVPFGTMPRTTADSPGFPYADVRETLPAMTDTASETSAIPFAVTTETLRRGQQRFDIYCSVCHGRLGDGKGMIVQRGLTPPPSFHIDRLRRVSDGHIYNVISNGYGQMFSYNDRVSPEDRWMIVAYIRALQIGAGPKNTMATLTEDDRRKLEGTRP
ncbi:MAG TPA: cytochrome c [Tepidisphaeraceae bacterium]|jgi:mono/diheme cytochrome c family protein|nr:cytochrome c [Tepidisphaeraceae bacterium]